jgi:hypothetical protein
MYVCLRVGAGLPDGVFSNQKSRFGPVWECLAMEEVGILYGYLVYFTAIWSILRLFGLFYGYLVYFTATRYSLWPFGL